MQTAVKNINERLIKAGYDVIEWEDITRNPEVTEVEYILSLSKGGDFDLDKEWSTLKKLASTEGFYIIPSNELIYGGPLSTATVRMINKDLIYPIRVEYLRLHAEMASSYWVLQGDDTACSVKTEIVEVHGLLYDVQREIKRMKTGTKHAELFSDLSTYNKWSNYRKGLFQLKDTASSEVAHKLPVNVIKTIIDLEHKLRA